MVAAVDTTNGGDKFTSTPRMPASKTVAQEVVPAVDPRKTPTAGATAGKSGAVPAAKPTSTAKKVTTAQASSASKKTGTKTNVSTNGAKDLSSGDLTEALQLANQEGTNVTDAFNAGAAAQAQADQAASSTASTGSSSTGTSSTTGGILSSITGSSKMLIILAGVVGVGYYLYRRNKNGSPLFAPAPSDVTESE